MVKVFLSKYINSVFAKWLTVLDLAVLSAVNVPYVKDYVTPYVNGPWLIVAGIVGVLCTYYVIIGYTR